MNLIDLNEAVNLYASKRRKVMKHIGSIVQLVDNGIPYSDIAAILSSKTGIDCSIRYLQDIVYQYRKKSGKTPGSFAGEPLVAVPSAPQTNQVAQPPKAPTQASQAVQSSGSPVKEVKAPVSVTEPAKEVKTTLEGKKAEEVKPAGVKSSREEVENMLREQNEERGALDIAMAHLRASFGGPALTLARATSYMGRPVTEEELPLLIERGNQLRAAGKKEIFG